MKEKIVKQAVQTISYEDTLVYETDDGREFTCMEDADIMKKLIYYLKLLLRIMIQIITWVYSI
jgi:hypothetical protein